MIETTGEALELLEDVEDFRRKYVNAVVALDRFDPSTHGYLWSEAKTDLRESRYWLKKDDARFLRDVSWSVVARFRRICAQVVEHVGRTLMDSIDADRGRGDWTRQLAVLRNRIAGLPATVDQLEVTPKPSLRDSVRRRDVATVDAPVATVPRPTLTTIVAPAPRRPVSGDLRALVWAKSGGRCWYCGRQTNPFDDFRADHVVPVADGGTNDPHNLVPACNPCNASKGAMHVEAFRAKRGGGLFWFEIVKGAG